MEKILQALKSRNMNGYLVNDKKGAFEKVVSLIDKTKQISCGGSVSLEQIGIMDELKNGDYDFIDRDLVKPNYFMKHWVMKKCISEGIFITGANAITKDGRIINMDGWGNRVNAINYGPERVIIVVGNNKIVENTDDALNRIATVAAPKNTKRLNKKTPCAETGKCMDCRSNDRICNILGIVQFQNDPDRIHVVIVDEELGY